MNTDSIIYHILLRLIKEKKYFNFFRKNYSIAQLQQFLKNQNIKCHSIDLNVILYDIYPLNVFIKHVTAGQTFNYNFKYLIFEYLKPFIYEFLESNDIAQLFEKEQQQSSFSIDKLSTQEYLNKLQNSGSNPLEFFLLAFNWSNTTNGYRFWKNIDQKYKIYINSILHSYKK